MSRSSKIKMLCFSADGQPLPYREYDKLAKVDAGAIVEHKRRSHALQVAQAPQAQRDDRRRGFPARTNKRTLHQGADRQRNLAVT
ncbi:hypothetical protein [Trinickia fusca]|uniref:Uncharacterized protein n=1 Tax=Trinickia fusca TaxID=2419777 RepID=A0A494X6H0_9BURK|nr:hypothetical protein [Trinickia fusca]RKP43846.1 hypothetical protein D7S89_24500 [Trinickia fusca]